MKWFLLSLLMLLGVTITVNAQDVDDDMYFVSSKKKTAKKASSKTTNQNVVPVKVVKPAEEDNDADADYHTGQLRDVDDYNRRGNSVSNGQVVAKLVNDTLYVYSNDSTEQKTYVYGEESGSGNKYYDDDNYYEDDYTYASRLGRYHSVHFSDPWYWDYSYGWYDPWYDPWYGWYAPYYRHGYYSWYDWGWGWHYYPSWSWGWGYSYPPYYHHPVYPGGGHPGGVAHRPVNPAYRSGSQRMGGYVSRGSNRTSTTRQGNVRADGDNNVTSRGSRNSVTSRDGYVSRSNRSSSSSQRETTTRNSNQSSRSNDSYRSSSTSSRSSSSTSSRSSSSSSSGFGGGSRGGSFGGSSSGSRGGSFGGGGGGSRGGGGGRGSR